MPCGRQFSIYILKFACGVEDALGILDEGKLSPGGNRALAMPRLWRTMAPDHKRACDWRLAVLFMRRRQKGDCKQKAWIIGLCIYFGAFVMLPHNFVQC